MKQYTDGEGAYFKAVDGKLKAMRKTHFPGGIILDWKAPDYKTATHNGWHWYDSEEEARQALDLPESDPDPE